MKQEHISSFDMLRTIAHASKIKSKRSFTDFFADRIVQACTQPTMLAAVERLAKTVDAEISELYQPVVKQFLVDINYGEDVLNWMRQYSTVAAMLVSLKKDDYLEAVKGIEIESAQNATGIAPPARLYEIPITIECLSTFAHGGDTKAGNATLFRRQTIISDTGKFLSLPFYAGNAFRGTMRDLLADHFLRSLGITPRKDHPPVSLWFFHMLYAGGVLEESGKAISKITDRLGKNGAINAGGVYEFRDMLPGLSLLGAAVGNRIMSGRVNFGDYRPRCAEYGIDEMKASELFEWTFITRREDHEDHEEHHGMIANTECLRAGVIMDGGIDTSDHITDLERSALGMGIFLAEKTGVLGAENRRGLGSVKITAQNVPDYALYEKYLSDNKSKIRKYMEDVDAVPSGQSDIFGD